MSISIEESDEFEISWDEIPEFPDEEIIQMAAEAAEIFVSSVRITAEEMMVLGLLKTLAARCMVERDNWYDDSGDESE